MRKKMKLLMSLATVCLAIAVLCFGVFAATSVVTYDIKGRISYVIEDVSVRITTKLYSSEEMFNSDDLRHRATHAVGGQFDTQDLTLIQLNGSDSHVYDSTVDDASEAVLDGVDLEFATEGETIIGTYFYIIEIENLGGFEIYAQPILDKAYDNPFYQMPENIVDYKTPNFISIDGDGTNYIVFAMSLQNSSNQVDGDYELPVMITKTRPAVDDIYMDSDTDCYRYTIIQDNLYPYVRIDGFSDDIENEIGYNRQQEIEYQLALYIPSYISGYPVKEIKGATKATTPGEPIESGAFEGYDEIIKVVFPSTLEILGKNCFARCRNLKSVYIPTTIAVIDAYKNQQPFYQCFNDEDNIDLYDHFSIYTDAPSYAETPSGWGPYWNRSASTLENQSIEKTTRVFYGYTFAQYCEVIDYALDDISFTLQERTCENIGIYKKGQDSGIELTEYYPVLGHEVENGVCTMCEQHFEEYEIHFNNLDGRTPIADCDDGYVAVDDYGEPDKKVCLYNNILPRESSKWQMLFKNYENPHWDVVYCVDEYGDIIYDDETGEPKIEERTLENDGLLYAQYIYTIIPIESNIAVTPRNTDSGCLLYIDELDARYNVLDTYRFEYNDFYSFTTYSQTRFLKLTLEPSSPELQQTALNPQSPAARTDIRICVYGERDNGIIHYNSGSEFNLPDCSNIGFEFLGWYSDPNFTSTKVEKIARGTTGDIELYPKFRYEKYAVSVIMNDGEFSGKYEVDPENGQFIIAHKRYREQLSVSASQFSKEYCTFNGLTRSSGKGWYNFDDVNNVGLVTMGQGNVVLKVSWKQKPLDDSVIVDQEYDAYTNEYFYEQIEQKDSRVLEFSIVTAWSDETHYENGQWKNVYDQYGHFGFDLVDDNAICGTPENPGTYHLKIQVRWYYEDGKYLSKYIEFTINVYEE